MATDFRSGNQYPRSGRREYGGFLWLLRAFDKARAYIGGTLHDYIYPCPMDRGVFQRWGITADEFTAAARAHTTDEAILALVTSAVPDTARLMANRWLLDEKVENLNRQDREEGVAAA